MSDFNTTMSKVLGERIKQLRLDNNLNQEAVAKQIGLDRTSVSNIEVGRHQPSLTVLYEISKIFKTDIHRLIPSYHEVVARSTMDNSNIDELLNKMPISAEAKDSIQKILDTL